MTMREKIADIFKRHHRDSCYPDALGYEALAFADAVLDAMREPTKGIAAVMIRCEDGSMTVGEAWAAMIDAAKGEAK